MAGIPARAGGVTSAPKDVPPIIRARNLGRSFGKRVALTGVDLDIEPGRILGVLGPDGSGKTTLLQLLAAILEPSEGACTVMGFDTRREDHAINARIGYMSQGFTLYDRLSVDENLRFAARIRGVSAKDYDIRSGRLLAMAGLIDFRSRRADQLSGGMRKKLSLSCSLIHQPVLLLLDEPSLGVDPLSRRELWEMLHTFRDEGATVVLSTPYMGEAEHCDRLCFLQAGRVLALDTPAGMRGRASGTVFQIAGADPAHIAEAVAAATEIGGMSVAEGIARVRTREANGLRTETAAALNAIGTLQPVAASMEEAFLFLSRKDTGTAPARASSVKASAGERVQALHENAVVLKRIRRTFGSFVALDNITLTVSRGEVFGFLGPNGAGKTTLIRILCGMLAPTAGSATVAGIDVMRHARRLAARVGYMSQQFSLYPDLTCAENLRFFGGVYGLTGRAGRSAIDGTVEMLDLQTALHHTVAQLSGAVRQRLALACSILHRPDVLFLDEPTSGIDPAARQRFWQLIQAQAESGITVFVTTHYLDEALNCDRIGLLSQGRLLAEGTLPELRQALGTAETATIEDVFMQYVLRARRETEPVQ